MIDLSIKINLFAPINHACPRCCVQPGQDCPAHLLEARPGEKPLYHRERIDLAFRRGMEAHLAAQRSEARMSNGG